MADKSRGKALKKSETTIKERRAAKREREAGTSVITRKRKG
ncbi:hypothetical protein [Nocardia cyriacigeorgica]|nr:hypothetical protein [Nocardia cyriacigeorgica]